MSESINESQEARNDIFNVHESILANLTSFVLSSVQFKSC